MVLSRSILLCLLGLVLTSSLAEAVGGRLRSRTAERRSHYLQQGDQPVASPEAPPAASDDAAQQVVTPAAVAQGDAPSATTPSAAVPAAAAQAAPAEQVGDPNQSPDELDEYTVHYGSPRVHPNVLAQARANLMARLGQMIHFGGGWVHTSHGYLSEGIGYCGPGGIPGTCEAVNGSAAIGDGMAVSASGLVFRARLYNSPQGTQYPGGGGGGGGGGSMRRWRGFR